MSFYQIVYEYIFIPLAHADTLTIFLGKVNRHVLNPIILILFSLAFVQFFLGVFKFFTAKSEGNEVAEAKKHLIWGIVGMVIMTSVFGIMNLITGSLGLEDISPGLRKGEGNPGDISTLFKE